MHLVMLMHARKLARVVAWTALVFWIEWVALDNLLLLEQCGLARRTSVCECVGIYPILTKNRSFPVPQWPTLPAALCSKRLGHCLSICFVHSENLLGKLRMSRECNVVVVGCVHPRRKGHCLCKPLQRESFVRKTFGKKQCLAQNNNGLGCLVPAGIGN